ncbi:uncharacterized protein LOC120329000 [Styela clava]
MNAQDVYKDELLKHFSDAVKQVQMEQMSLEQENGLYVISNDSPTAKILCTSLDMIFLHGLKHKEYGCWEAVRYFCRNDILRQIEKLRNVKTNLGRGRAWIFIALNEKEFEGFLQSFQMDMNHIYKYYHKSAMLCSSQVFIMQTLISGLDHVTFKLNPDLSHLDFKIAGPKVISNSTVRTVNHRPTNQPVRGSSVHIDTGAVTDMAAKTSQKAVGFVKGLLSHENSYEAKSIGNKTTLVAVNSARFKAARKECPDCKTSSELICLCIKENHQMQNTSVPSSNAKLLDSIFNKSGDISEASISSVPSCSNQRVNPFNELSTDKNEVSMAESNLRRFDQHMPIVDTPIEVVRKKKQKKRNKKFSDSGSDISTKSEDILVHSIRRIKTVVVKRRGSMNDIILSDPLIGFDPGVEECESTSSLYSDHLSDIVQASASELENINPNHEGASQSHIGVMSSTEGDYNAISEMCNNDHLTQTFVSNQSACYVSSQGSLNTTGTNDRVEITTGYKKPISDNNLESTTSMTENSADTGNGNIEDIMEESTMTSNLEENLSETLNSESEKDLHNNITETNVPKEKVVSNSTITDNENSAENVENTDMTTDVVVTTSPENENLTTIHPDVSENLNSTDDSSSVNNDNVSLRSDEVSNQKSVPESNADFKNNNFEKLSASFGGAETKNTHITGKKKRTMRRYRSESEDLLNALTKKEVERLRAEIQNKLKPSQDRLEKVRKSIAEKKSSRVGVGSFHHDSTFMLDEDRDSEASSSSRPLFDDLSDDAQSTLSFDNDTQADEDVSACTGDSSSLFSESASSLPATWRTVVNSASKKIPNSNIITESDLPHRAVADIDNTLRLYLMLEILMDENEAFIKMFHLSTGHAEGNWTPLYLLFTDSFVYFLRSGDGSCPYQPEEIVSYEDLDYIAVGSNSQTMQFVFYKNKSRPSKSSKVARGKVRTKLTIDTADKKLTELIISNLSRALVSFTRQQSVIKVCPPIFHDAKEHQISLRKYMVAEGLTGDIQLYQLIHWEDPNFVTGASMSKISMEGTLKYRAVTFWGSTWRSAYFVLNGGILYQYENKDSEKPFISYELTRNNCVGCKRLRSTSSKTPSLQFEIVFADETKIELCGYSDIEVTEWLQCLCMIVSLDQSSLIDKEGPPDGIVMNMLHHDALVPCSMIIVDEQLLLCHEDQHTGFCRTLSKTFARDITQINIDKKTSLVCEIVINICSEQPQTLNWGIFFSCVEALEDFLSVMNSFSKAPTLNDAGSKSSMTHYLEARTLLDNRWTRTDNLLKGRGGSVENYTFI